MEINKIIEVVDKLAKNMVIFRGLNDDITQADIINTVSFSVHQKMQDAKSINNIKYYIITSLRNETIKRLKQTQKQKNTEVNIEKIEEPQIINSPLNQAITTEILEIILEIVPQKLQKYIIYLVEDISFKKISEVENIPYSTVKKHIAKIRNILKNDDRIQKIIKTRIAGAKSAATIEYSNNTITIQNMEYSEHEFITKVTTLTNQDYIHLAQEFIKNLNIEDLILYHTHNSTLLYPEVDKLLLENPEIEKAFEEKAQQIQNKNPNKKEQLEKILNSQIEAYKTEIIKMISPKKNLTKIYLEENNQVQSRWQKKISRIQKKIKNLSEE